MANDTHTDRQQPVIFRLTLGNVIFAKGPGELVLDQNIQKLFKDRETNASYYIMLRSVKMNRKIYQPTEIECELDFMLQTINTSGAEEMTAPSFKAVTDMFLRRRVKLEVGSYTLAENCYVFEVNPMLKRDTNGTKMYVKLNIFSMDKLMTLNKYSKAYVARKLGSGILKPESLTFGKDAGGESPIIKTNIKNLRFLKYDEMFSVLDNEGRMTLTSIPSEFIQPYLVQYNESFYDFLVRTANRCGEFLYFEDGELTLGLPDSGDPQVIDDFESVTVQSITEAPLDIPVYARDSAKEGIGAAKHYNYTPIEKKGDGYPKGVFPDATSYNSELATDEYIFPLYKDKATDLEREMMLDGGYKAAIFNVMKTLKNYAKTTKSGGKAILDTAIKTGAVGSIQSFFVWLKAGKINDKLYSQFFSPLKNNSEQCNDDKVVQFGTLSDRGWTTLDYYHDVRQHEEKQMQEIICINMSTNFYPLKLGQKIKIAGNEQTYVVIQIQQSSEGEWMHHYETYDGRSAERAGDQRLMKIFAIPSYEDSDKKECFIPPVQPVPVIRKSGPQTAFIVASNDPKYQGRVRIVYPWQSLGTQIQERFDAAVSALEEAQTDQALAAERTAQFRKEYQRVLAEKEEMENWAKMSDSEREIRRKELEDELLKLEQSIQKREDAIAKATQAVRDKETEISHLPADTEDREGRLSELEDDKQVLILQKNDTINENNPKIAEEKEALARKKAHLAELAEVEDKSKREAALQNKQEELVHASDNLMEAEDKENGYKADVKDKEEAKEKAEADKNKKLESIATPWIRIATPVATDGGGFFYEPRKGDEVLVNFDNDNVERPYVVGELYSKETLDPRERMNRKKGTRALGSMALVSPNGHHIAFQDPEDGAKFLNSTVPVIGAFNKAATLGLGIPAFSALHPKKAKDLTGGIHMGDRYGLYEISMSSDGRKININSPLGQVNLNAFTGISIDAPNGDIKIRGKNVNISAGNKVTIESGTNIGMGGGIGGPGYKYTNDDHWYNVSKGLWSTGTHVLGHEVLLSLAPEAGKVAYSEAIPATNVELLRYITQVFLRPIDGTMLIKSRKYMLLEAGKGKAMVKADRYKKKKADDYFKVYESLIACVDYIQNGLRDFYETYDDLWEKAANLRSSWITMTYQFFFVRSVIPDIPNAVKSYYNGDRNQEWDEKCVTDFITENKFQNGYYTKEKAEKAKKLVSAYGEAVFNLLKHIKSVENLILGIHENRYVPQAPLASVLPKSLSCSADVSTEVAHEPLIWVLDILKQTFKEAKLLDEWRSTYEKAGGTLTEDFIHNTWPKDIFTEHRTEFKRRMVCMFLLNFSKSEQNKKNHYIHIGFNEYHFIKDSSWYKLRGSMWGKEKLSKDYYWRRFVKNMDRYVQNSNFWRVLLDSFSDTYYTNKFKKELWTTTDIWDKGQGGQILMSDNRDYTLNLVKDGVLCEDAANQFNLERLKQKLYDVK
jgi:uncharacterized protein involved in type VI secretion and phage assembly